MLRRRLICEMRAITWMNEVGELFDFNTSPREDHLHFRGFIQQLPVPKNESSQHYYFLHQPIDGRCKDQLLIERRMQLKSNLAFLNKSAKSYKLIGGFKLSFRRKEKAKKVYLQLIEAKDIQVASLPLGLEMESIERQLPYLVVRSLAKGIAVKNDQIIKLGKTLLRVDEVVLSQFQKGFQNTSSQVNLDSDKGSITDQEGEVKTCRYCLQSEDETANPLVSLCKCRGSSRYQHITCLQSWLKCKLTKLQKNEQEGKVFHIKELFCQICKSPLPKTVLHRGISHNLLPFLESENPFIGLSNLSTGNQYQDDIIYVEVPDSNEEVKIGRLDTNNMIVADNSVSRNHGCFKMHRQQEIRICDSGSKFGTLVYQKDLTVRLQEGSSVAVEIGNSVFSFKLVEV